MRKQQLSRPIALGLTAVLWLGSSAGATVTDRDKVSARYAARYLVKQQEPDGSIPGFSRVGTTADAVVSLVAARRGPRAIESAIEYLRAHEAEVNNVGLKAKVVMALVAAGHDPRNFEGRNLVREIRRTERGTGRLGAGTAVFDHALGMLALVAADVQPSHDMRWWLVKAQCADGGWEYESPAGSQDAHCNSGAPDDYFPSDTNTTSLAVQALRFGRTLRLQTSPFSFFRATRDDRKRGWGYTFGYMTDTNSTALVIQAYVAVGEDLPQGAKDALRRLQYGFCDEGGAFAYTWVDDGDGTYSRSGPDVGATVGAIPGLVEKPFPIRHYDVTKGAPRLDCQT